MPLAGGLFSSLSVGLQWAFSGPPVSSSVGFQWTPHWTQWALRWLQWIFQRIRIPGVSPAANQTASNKANRQANRQFPSVDQSLRLPFSLRFVINSIFKAHTHTNTE